MHPAAVQLKESLSHKSSSCRSICLLDKRSRWSSVIPGKLLVFMAEDELADGFFRCVALSHLPSVLWGILLINPDYPSSSKLNQLISCLCSLFADEEQEGLRRSTSSPDHCRWEEPAFRLIALFPLWICLFAGERDTFRGWAASLVAF